MNCQSYIIIIVVFVCSIWQTTISRETEIYLIYIYYTTEYLRVKGFAHWQLGGAGI